MTVRWTSMLQCMASTTKTISIVENNNNCNYFIRNVHVIHWNTWVNDCRYQMVCNSSFDYNRLRLVFKSSEIMISNQRNNTNNNCRPMSGLHAVQWRYLFEWNCSFCVFFSFVFLDPRHTAVNWIFILHTLQVKGTCNFWCAYCFSLPTNCFKRFMCYVYVCHWFIIFLLINYRYRKFLNKYFSSF